MSISVTEHERSGSMAVPDGCTVIIPTQRAAPPAAPRRDGAAPPRRDAQEPPGRTTGRTPAQKAYARREGRLRRAAGGEPARTGAPAGRAQFVLLVMVALVGGLVATLWLSTSAAADSYRLQDARAEARALSRQSERLHREVAALRSAPELARRATELGMVRVQDPARLVVGPDGAVTVVGLPQAAVPPAPAMPAPGAAVPVGAAGPTGTPGITPPADGTGTTPAPTPAAGDPATAAQAGADPAGPQPAVDPAPQAVGAGQVVGTPTGGDQTGVAAGTG